MNESPQSHSNSQLILIEFVLRASDQCVPLTLKLLYEFDVFRLSGYELKWIDYTGLYEVEDKNGEPVKIPRPADEHVLTVWQAYADLLNLISDHQNTVESIHKINGKELYRCLENLSVKLSNLNPFINMANDKAACYAHYAKLINESIEYPENLTADKVLGHCSNCNHGQSSTTALPHCDFSRAAKALQQNWNLLNTDDSAIPLPEAIVLTWLKQRVRPS